MAEVSERWVADEPAPHSGAISIRAKSGNLVAMIPPGYGHPDREAIAALIAAAPDLLAACELALPQLVNEPAANAVREAIAKARGTTTN